MSGPKAQRISGLDGNLGEVQHDVMGPRAPRFSFFGVPRPATFQGVRWELWRKNNTYLQNTSEC